ncbi:MAG: hypothetical protein ABL901_11995 [Hyphomicrobiaceae bacterium]
MLIEASDMLIEASDMLIEAPDMLIEAPDMLIEAQNMPHNVFAAQLSRSWPLRKRLFTLMA